MSYAYAEQRCNLFTDEGQRMLLKIRDTVQRHLDNGGAVKMGHAIAGCSGDSWMMLACVDRLVELGELREIPQGQCAGQDRVFVGVR